MFQDRMALDHKSRPKSQKKKKKKKKRKEGRKKKKKNPENIAEFLVIEI